MLRSPMAKRLGAKTGVPERSFNAKFYGTSAWLKLRIILLRRNPVCQRLSKTLEQCHNASVIGHHLISPIDSPHLALVSENIVMLCRSCHPDTQGTPSWVEGIDYIKTVQFGDT